MGELEQQLDEIREAHQADEDELKDQIHGLELDLQSFRSRCLLLESMLDRERQERIRAETEAEALKRSHGNDLLPSQNMSAPRPSLKPSLYPNQHDARHHNSVSEGRNGQPQLGGKMPISQVITPPDSYISSDNPEADAAITCGNCSPNGRCACAEQVLASAASGCGKCGFGLPCQCLDDFVIGQGQDQKRPSSPTALSPGGKRQRSVAVAKPATETDFTAIFSTRFTASAKASQSSHPQASSSGSQIPSGGSGSVAFKDSCGFCKDGTYCVCAEDAAGMATPAWTPTESMAIASHQTQTPPPSEPDVLAAPLAMEMTAEGAVKLPRRVAGKRPAATSSSSRSSGCGANGPGTCAQCQADPKSGLFCRLMNAKYSREQGISSGGCCGGKGASGGCCKSKAQPEKITLPSLPSLGLSCAEAYQTLSSHKNFSRAADDISSWLPKLKATTQDASRGLVTGRHAIEVEAASIMSVLKEFDIRFGRDA